MVIQGIAAKIKIPVVVLGSLILVYLSVSVVILPSFLTSKIPELIAQETGRKAFISKIQVQPFPLAIRVQGFEMQEADGAVFAKFADFYIRLGFIQSIRQSALVIEQLILTKPLIHIARQKQGDFNFHSLIKIKADDKQAKGEFFPLNILQLKVSDGQLNWEDFSSGQLLKETLAPINVKLENFTTQTDQQANVNLSLTLSSGGTLNWQGLAGLNPKMSEGHVELDHVHLETLLALANQHDSL